MFQYKKKLKYLLFVTMLLFLMLPFISSAQQPTGSPEPVEETGSPEPVEIKNPIGVDSIEDFITAILDIAVKIGTPIAVLFIIYSGFLFVTARGNADKINHAKETFLYTIIGVVILLGAEAISNILSRTVEDIRDSSFIEQDIDFS